MRSFFGRIVGRLRNRPDSEHEPAILRFIVGAIAAYWLVRAALEDGVLGTHERLAIWLVALFLGAAAALLALILARPGVSVARRYAGMILDIAATSVVIAIEGELAAPIFPVYLWVVFGNGFRYGQRALAFSAALSVVGFLLATFASGFGRTSPQVVAGLLAGLVVLPLYVSFLLSKLTGALEQAQAADEARTRFFANVGRELRTPLHGILGTAEVLLEGRLSEEQRRSVLLVHRSASRLLEVLVAVLELTRPRAGRTMLEQTDFTLPAAVEEVVALYREVAGTGGPRVEARIGADVPRTVRGDRQKLLQVLQNLLLSAVERTPKGRVTVAVRAASSRGGRAGVAFTVADTGVGIPPETRARIFEPFAPPEEPRSGAPGRTAFGPPLIRDLVAVLDGEIALESEPGHGTSVTLTVPLEPGDPARITEATADRPPGRLPRPPAWRSRPRVLVVEGNAISREVLGTLLRHFGCEAIFAESGPEALAAVSRERFDLLLLACQLPGMDGYETAREIRRRLPPQALPIIALSASASTDHLERSRAAGMEESVAKPFRAAELLEALRHRLASHIAPDGSPAPATPRPDDLVGTGMPSGGIAPRAAVHEINNALTGLLGYADLLAASLDGQAPLKRYADRILEAGERARQILLALPRG